MIDLFLESAYRETLGLVLISRPPFFPFKHFFPSLIGYPEQTFWGGMGWEAENIYDPLQK